MRSPLFALLVTALLPMSAASDGTPQPNYPPSFDCSAVAAGSQRQACNRSQLNPPMGAVPEPRRTTPQNAPRQPVPVRPQNVKPPTIPQLPGTINPN